MKKLIGNYWPYFIIILLSLAVAWPLMRNGYFSHQDDLQIIRIFEMRRCFSDGQIPCRWVPDMGWGNGLPLFNFYGVFPYYLGAILSYLTGFIGSAKILFFLALSTGSLGMYLLAKNLWGKLAGVTAAILYLFAPYKALDIYVRGALAESLALAIIPFVFYFAKKKNYTWFILTLFIFLITHNIMTLIFFPVLIGWLIYLLIEDGGKNFKAMFLSVLIGVGLSAFFILPAFFEKNLIQTESLTRFELDYRANFVKVGQLFFDRSWGYGTSIPGPLGGMSFQIGWPHWWLAIISGLCLSVAKVRKRTKYLIGLFLSFFVLSVFMTHNKSTFIWVRIPILQYFQFPWRFLSLSIFTAALLGGFVTSVFRGKWQTIICVGICVAAIILNWSYFKPKEFYTITDAQKLSDGPWEDQRRGALLDYLPKTALEPREAAPSAPLLISGTGEIANFINQSNQWAFTAVISNKAEIDMPVFYFPNWQVKVNGRDYPLSYNNVLGRISVTLDPGNYQVRSTFQNTPLRTVANLITVLSTIGLICFSIWKKSDNL